MTDLKQRHPSRLVAVLVGSDDEQAQAFADKVITVADLFEDREQLCEAVAEIV